MYRANSREELYALIITYRKNNALPELEFLEQVVENYMASLPENMNKTKFIGIDDRTILMYIKGGVAVLQNLWYGEKNMVSQKEADDRATLCISCPHNVFPDKCSLVAWSDTIAEKSVGKRKAVHHDKLGTCEVCTCTLKAKVFYKGDMGLTMEQKNKMSNVNCWQVK